MMDTMKYDQEIPFDDDNPIVLEISDDDHPGFGGWRWVWLQTKFALFREYEATGVHLDAEITQETDYPVSLRDPEGRVHLNGICNENGFLPHYQKNLFTHANLYKSLGDAIHEHTMQQAEMGQHIYTDELRWAFGCV